MNTFGWREDHGSTATYGGLCLRRVVRLVVRLSLWLSVRLWGALGAAFSRRGEDGSSLFGGEENMRHTDSPF